MEENGSGAHETGTAHVGLLTPGKGEDGKHVAASTTPPSKLSFGTSKNGGVGGKETTKETTKETRKVEARIKQSWVRVSLFMEPLGGGGGGGQSWVTCQLWITGS